MAEFDLIERIRRRATPGAGVFLGIGDDAALLRVPDGHALVVTADTLNAGVHFPDGTAPADIGWKTLAVNLSDLAAMGARPAWCTLSLSLPADDPDWLDGFLDGFLELADAHAVALVGGDTTRGPLSIAVTAMGWVEAGAALRRDGAREGDDVWVTGTLGDAAAALLLDGHVPPPGDDAVLPAATAGIASALRMRLARPTPRVAAGLALAGLAHACVDVSDGLFADLGHLCRRSGVGAEVELAQLPASPALLAAVVDPGLRAMLQAGGGDDYELCFTAPERARAAMARALDRVDTAGTRIGHDGSSWQPGRSGYVHFG